MENRAFQVESLEKGRGSPRAQGTEDTVRNVV